MTKQVIAPAPAPAVEPVIEKTSSPDGNKGTVLKQVKATDEVRGLNINKRPNFTTDKGVITIEGAEESFELVEYDNTKMYAMGTFGRLYSQVDKYPASLFGNKCVPETIEEMSEVLGVPVPMIDKYGFFVFFQNYMRILSETPKDDLVKATVKVVQQLKDEGFSEANIGALMSPQKGVKDRVFRPTFSTREFKQQWSDKLDLVVTVSFEKDSDKQTYLKEYPTLSSMLLAYDKQRGTELGYKTLQDFLTAETSYHNGTAKVQTVERKKVEVALSNADLGI